MNMCVYTLSPQTIKYDQYGFVLCCVYQELL